MSLLSMPTQQPTSAHHHSFHSHTTLSMSLGSPCCHSLSPTPPTPPSKLTLQQRPRVRSVCASTPQQALLPPPAAAHHHHSQHTCCRQGVVTHSSGGQTSINADVPTSLEPEQPSTSGRSSSSSSDSSTTTPLVSFQEMQEIAAARGLHLALKTLGPFYRITCRDGGPEGKVVGVTNGFVAPLFGLMHCDTLQIFTRGLKGQEGERLRKNPLGLGLLLGGAVFSYGLSCGCSKAEILAINDDDAWHERLVRYYTYFGFKPVCKVGGQGFVKDVPHLLVWGGEGTRMDADMQQALQRWTPALRQSREKKQQPGTKQRQEPA